MGLCNGQKAAGSSCFHIQGPTKLCERVYGMPCATLCNSNATSRVTLTRPWRGKSG